MAFDSSWLRDLGLAWLVARAILFSLLGILLLVGFIVFRRWYRGRYFERLNRRTVALREQWPDILSGKIPGSAWRLNVLDCQIVEDILLDNIEVSDQDQLPIFLACLRNSGLLDLRIREARSSEGWRKRLVLLALGRTRAPEAVPALVEALESASEETRVAAVRGLGQISSPQAALPLLDLFVADELHVPEHTLKNALLSCCREAPEVLVPYLNHANGRTRELIARVLGELAGSQSWRRAADPSSGSSSRGSRIGGARARQSPAGSLLSRALHPSCRCGVVRSPSRRDRPEFSRSHWKDLRAAARVM